MSGIEKRTQFLIDALLETLFVGVDDSNHAGEDKIGEIILAIFSFDPKFGTIADYPDKREANRRSRYFNYLKSGRFDFRYTVLIGDKFRKGGHNVSLLSPFLVRSFLESLPDWKRPKNLNLSIDGKISEGDKKFLKGQFSDYDSRFKVEGFKKIRASGEMPQHYHCPAVVHMADSLANYIYNHSFHNAFTKPLYRDKFVEVNLEEIYANERRLLRH